MWRAGSPTGVVMERPTRSGRPVRRRGPRRRPRQRSRQIRAHQPSQPRRDSLPADMRCSAVANRIATVERASDVGPELFENLGPVSDDLERPPFLVLRCVVRRMTVKREAAVAPDARVHCCPAHRTGCGDSPASPELTGSIAGSSPIGDPLVGVPALLSSTTTRVARSRPGGLSTRAFPAALDVKRNAPAGHVPARIRRGRRARHCSWLPASVPASASLRRWEDFCQASRVQLSRGVRTVVVLGSTPHCPSGSNMWTECVPPAAIRGAADAA
jgi:hypothetical protein